MMNLFLNQVALDFQDYFVIMNVAFSSLDHVRDTLCNAFRTKRPHQGRGMNGRTPLKAFMDGLNQKDQAGNKAAKKAA